jgi:hypothetical protein
VKDYRLMTVQRTGPRRPRPPMGDSTRKIIAGVIIVAIVIFAVATLQGLGIWS